jgi:hypothetical protein
MDLELKADLHLKLDLIPYNYETSILTVDWLIRQILINLSLVILINQ